MTLIVLLVSIGMMENFQDAEIMYQVVKPLKAVGMLEPSEKPQGESRMSSGSTAARSFQVSLREGAPARPVISKPPA